MNLVDDGLFNGDSVQAMKKDEARTVPGFHLDYWLIGDYNDQDNPYYVCDESDGSSCFINCGKDSSLGTVDSQIKELQKTKAVKEIIFPEVEYGPEVRVNIKDYPKSVTFTRTS